MREKSAKLLIQRNRKLNL